MHELAPNPYIAPFDMDLLPRLPISMRHALAYTALAHRAQRAAQVADNSHSISLRSRMYYHRGLALRSLVSDVSGMEPRTNDAVIASVLCFLVGEVSRPSLLRASCSKDKTDQTLAI